MSKRIGTIAAFAAGAVFGSLALVSSSGQAAVHHRAAAVQGSGAYTYVEWANTSEGQSQANVEGANGCSCTGVTTNTWTYQGVDHKQVAYPLSVGDEPTTGEGAFLNYAKIGGVWTTDNWKGWSADDGANVEGLEFKYPVNIVGF